MPIKLPKWNNPIAKVMLSGIALYLFIGFLYYIGTLVCYNVRNWEIYGGFSLPPLFLLGLFSYPFLWPVYLRANLINGFGILHCTLP